MAGHRGFTTAPETAHSAAHSPPLGLPALLPPGGRPAAQCYRRPCLMMIAPPLPSGASGPPVLPAACLHFTGAITRTRAVNDDESLLHPRVLLPDL